ncbi:MAG: LPS-assembly protein LptD [Candidatus Omnitrophica bacterium]|nr:LPS-assembly protein LptD [Candidatus Omnitrophota bacterium]
MKKFYFLPIFLFLTHIFIQPAYSDEPAPPVQVHGDTVEYFEKEQKVVGTGNVSIDHQGSRLTADKITLYMATKTAVAEGNVVLRQGENVYRGQRGEYNYLTRVGNVSDTDANFAPYMGKARQIQKVSDNHYRAVDAYLTTCCGDNPLYKIQAQQVDIFPGDKVSVRNALLMIKGVPILYIPFYTHKISEAERFPVQLVPGKNEDWGAFLLSKWRYHLADSPAFALKGNALLDYREKRGFGYGADNFYRGDKIGRGAARVYSINDKEPPMDAEEERYRAQWRHQVPITDSTTVTAEINKLSDPTVTKDFFFREEYESNIFPDNYVSIVTAKPEYTWSILERRRLDDFFTVVERDPEVRFDTHNRAFVDTPLYLREEFQFSNLKKEFANTETSLEATRFDIRPTLSYAGRVGEVSVTPRIGTRQTFYSATADSDENHSRGVFETGVDLSTRFYKVYDTVVNTWGLDINRIRHIFAPTASYNYRPSPTLARTALQRFDAMDDLDKEDFVRFQFENKFQTQYGDKDKGLETREVARIVPFFDANLETGRLENAGYDVELRPYPWLGIYSDGLFDERTEVLETFNNDIFWEKTHYRVGVGQRYVREESNQLTGQFQWKINPGLEIKVYDRFEIEHDRSQEFEISISKLVDCVIVDFTYNHRDEGDTFYIVFRLQAFPRASFGLTQSYREPKSGQRFF